MSLDQHALDFALRWRHWGGGLDEDILVEFGLTPAQYFRRLHRFLHSGGARHLPNALVTELTGICVDRLRRPEP